MKHGTRYTRLLSLDLKCGCLVVDEDGGGKKLGKFLWTSNTNGCCLGVGGGLIRFAFINFLFAGETFDSSSWGQYQPIHCLHVWEIMKKNGRARISHFCFSFLSCRLRDHQVYQLHESLKLKKACLTWIFLNVSDQKLLKFFKSQNFV